MEELNRRGKEFINKWNSQVHGTTKRIPDEHYVLEEKQTLQKLPETRFRIKNLQPRKVSPDSLVSIDASKYSVPVKYVDKKVFYRIVYGFRIEIYDKDEKLILKTEKVDTKGTVTRVDEHYADIAVPVSTSIPQIRRDFSSVFSNGQRYLDEAGRRFEQPTHHARKILMLRELYDDATLDLFIAYSIENEKMDIASFKSLLKDYNAGKLPCLPVPGTSSGALEAQAAGPSMAYRDDAPALTRDCSYYEENTMVEVTG